MSPADTLERDLARALTAKADQVEVADPPPTFAPDEQVAATVIHLTPRRTGRQRVGIAAAAAALAVVLAIAGVGVLVGRDAPPDVASERHGPVAGRYGAPGDGPVGFLPAVPAGWTLTAIDAATSLVDGVPRRSQLFGAGDATPLATGVIVTSSAEDFRVVPDPNTQVHGVPAQVGPSPDPSHPAGAVTVQWIEGGVSHDAIAVGLAEDDLVAFLDGLRARVDPTMGFDAPASALAPLGEVTVAGARGSSVTYEGPGGPAGAVRISTSSSDPYGGLLHRFDGAPGPDGWSLVRRGHWGGDGPAFLSATRPDGWTVEIHQVGPAAVDPATLDALLGSLQPATAADLLDLARAQPVTARYAVDDRTVEVHGTAREDVGVCLASAGASPVCTTAEAAGDHRITASSLVVDGRWLLVTITGEQDLEVQTAPSDPARWNEYDSVELTPEASGVSDDDVQIGIYEVPADAEAVESFVMAGDLGTGVSYDNPLG